MDFTQAHGATSEHRGAPVSGPDYQSIIDRLEQRKANYALEMRERVGRMDEIRDLVNDLRKLADMQDKAEEPKQIAESTASSAGYWVALSDYAAFRIEHPTIGLNRVEHPASGRLMWLPKGFSESDCKVQWHPFYEETGKPEHFTWAVFEV